MSYIHIPVSYTYTYSLDYRTPSFHFNNYSPTNSPLKRSTIWPMHHVVTVVPRGGVPMAGEILPASGQAVVAGARKSSPPLTAATMGGGIAKVLASVYGSLPMAVAVVAVYIMQSTVTV